jgi:tyrosyl-tRNA synthetase
MDKLSEFCEIIGKDLLDEKIKDKKYINAYWGTASTGEPHFAYILPLLKVKQMIDLGWNVTILIADVHSYMDKGFSETSNVMERADYYEFIIKTILKRLNVEENKYKFKRGSDYQFDKTYCRDLLKFLQQLNHHLM